MPIKIDIRNNVPDKIHNVIVNPRDTNNSIVSFGCSDAYCVPSFE